MNSKDSKSSRELKQEVMQELNRVNSDLDHIQGRLTPGQIIDDSIFYPMGGNPRAVFDHLAANPIGTAFLGLGTLLLMEGESHATFETQLKQKGSAVMENARYQATLFKGTAENVNEKFQEKVGEYKENIQGMKSKVRELKDKIPRREKVTGEKDLGAGGELGVSSIDNIKDNFIEAKETLKNLDPMAWVAMGAGLGVLTGMALPVSEKEQSFVDQKLSGGLTQFSNEFQDALNKSVQILKEEFLGKAAAYDVKLFGRKQDVNETYRDIQAI